MGEEEAGPIRSIRCISSSYRTVYTPLLLRRSWHSNRATVWHYRPILSPSSPSSPSRRILVIDDETEVYDSRCQQIRPYILVKRNQLNRQLSQYILRLWSQLSPWFQYHLVFMKHHAGAAVRCTAYKARHNIEWNFICDSLGSGSMNWAQLESEKVAVYKTTPPSQMMNHRCTHHASLACNRDVSDENNWCAVGEIGRPCCPRSNSNG